MSAPRMMIGQRLIPAILLCAFLFACTTAPMGPRDERAFQRAERNRSVEAYQRFAESYPASPLAERALQRAAELQEAEVMKEFEAIRDRDKTSFFERLIERYPDTKGAFLAKLRVAEIDFNDLVTQNAFRSVRPGNSSWEGFLRVYAYGEYLTEPEDPELRKAYYDTLHPLILQALANYGAYDGWFAYVVKFPRSPYFDRVAGIIEKSLSSQAGSWEGYKALQQYLVLYEQKKGAPCPNRDALLRKVQDSLADAIIKEGSAEDLQQYLQAFPQSPRNREIDIALGHQQFREAFFQNDPAVMQSLVDRYAASDVPQLKEDVQKARVLIEQADLKEAENLGTAEAFMAFRDKYKSSDYANLVPRVEDRLERKRREILARARTVEGVEGLREFLKRFPDSPETAAVLRELQEAELKMAIASEDPEQIRAFLKRYPESVYAQQAEVRIEEIAYRLAEREAKDGPTTAPLREYIARYPQGAFVKDASRLLNELNEHHADYMKQYRRADESNNFTRFGEWINTAQANYYAARRGREDLARLKRIVTARNLREDVTTVPPQASRRFVNPSLAKDLDARQHGVVHVQTNLNQGTGFAITPEGLVVANLNLIRPADPRKIAVTADSSKIDAEVHYLPQSGGPGAAVLKLTEPVDAVPLGNPDILEKSDKVFCLSAREGKVVQAEGTYLDTRRAGNVDWLRIEASSVPASLGGVVLDRRADAIGLIIPTSEVDPSVVQGGNDFVYAISMKSLLPAIEAAVLQE